jgi:hypothetical protein
MVPRDKQLSDTAEGNLLVGVRHTEGRQALARSIEAPDQAARPDSSPGQQPAAATSPVALGGRECKPGGVEVAVRRLVGAYRLCWICILSACTCTHGCRRQALVDRCKQIVDVLLVFSAAFRACACVR